jgi:hypothetical protein
MRPLRQTEWVLLALAAVGIIGFLVVWELSSAPDPGDVAYKRGDYETAAREWRSLAEQGDAASQNKLARMYDTGKGVAKNAAEAAKLYRRAAEQGLASAQNKLGAMLHAGRGLPVASVEALMWFEIAATRGLEAAAANRDRAAQSMPTGQVDKAKQQARRWLEKHPEAD